MDEKEFLQRQITNTKTQFDYQPPGVDINLIMGVPAEQLLNQAADRFTRGVNHKMVIFADYTPSQVFKFCVYVHNRRIQRHVKYSSMAQKLEI
jgi:hypothetical protein